MQRFEFPLESVLRLRRFAEADARQALQLALVDLHRAEEALDATRHQIAAETADLQVRLRAILAQEAVQAWRQLELLEQLALKQAAEVADREAEVAVKQQAYLAAQQERKPLERLKEEMARTHWQQAEAAEQAVNDELAMTGFSRRPDEPEA